ncbi:MAG: cbb3-type cytochrome c oxidase subunit 3 [Ideonella sp.]|nr:cbb3-type cytochrome c oxidase subunit 3 [Ideonella sp.]MBL0147791.1 cbb3-type cytochrome c oxidase subunit 3 [Ideonella sp.]
MELNVLRSAMTLISFIVFLGIIVWAWNRQRSASFDEAANLPLLDDGSGVDSTGPRSQGAKQ